MFQILETATLLRLLDAAPEAVRHTIETGEWTGCLWPDHPEWQAHEACIQIRSLALHYFTVRYPAADAHRHDLAADRRLHGGLRRRRGPDPRLRPDRVHRPHLVPP